MGLDSRIQRLRVRLNASHHRSDSDAREQLASHLQVISERQDYSQNPTGNESVATLTARVLGSGSRLECAALRHALAERDITGPGRKLANNALRLRGE